MAAEVMGIVRDLEVLVWPLVSLMRPSSMLLHWRSRASETRRPVSRRNFTASARSGYRSSHERIEASSDSVRNLWRPSGSFSCLVDGLLWIRSSS